MPFESTSADITQMLGSSFNIVKAEIVTNKGRSRGMATVEFASKEDAQEAIARFDRSQLLGREIFVRQDYPPPEDKRREERRERERPERRDDRKERRRERLDPNEPPKPGTEVFVGNLPFSTTWQVLKDLMRTAGDVVRADVMTTKFGKLRGFGTVVFNSAEEAAAAVAKFQGYALEGRELEVRPGRDVGERRSGGSGSKNSAFTEGVVGDGEPSRVIFVGNLPYITTEQDLFELFETIGTVTRAEVQYNDRGRPSGNAVVEFDVVESADLAIRNLHGYNYGGRDLDLSFAWVPQAAQPVQAPVEQAPVEQAPVEQVPVDAAMEVVEAPVPEAPMEVVQEPVDDAMV